MRGSGDIWIDCQIMESWDVFNKHREAVCQEQGWLITRMLVTPLLFLHWPLPFQPEGNQGAGVLHDALSPTEKWEGPAG